MLNLVPLVGKLWHDGFDQHRGTVWLLTPELVLSAAHCVGNTSSQKLLPSPFKIEFAGVTERIEAQVVRHDFPLDAALLRLARPVPLAGGAVLLALLPSVQDFPEDKLKWRSYAFPSGNPHGMALDGRVTLPNGIVQGQPAIQLLCDQGGTGGIDGASGGPVCIADEIVGLIRAGSHQERVIYATSVRELASLFPEVKARLEQSPRTAGRAPAAPDQGAYVYSDVDIYLALTSIREISFEEVVFRLGVNKAQLPSDQAEQARRAMALIELCKERYPDGLAPLVRILERTQPVVLQRIRDESDADGSGPRGRGPAGR